MHKRKREDLEVVDHNVKVEEMKSLKRLVADKTFCTVLSFEKIENVIEKWTVMVTNFREFGVVPRSFLLYCSVLLWPTSRENYLMEWGKFYAHSVLFFIVVLTMTHFSDKLSDGAIIIKLVRNVHVWILIVVRDHPSKLWMT